MEGKPQRKKRRTLLHVEIERGYCFKVIVDILAGSLERTMFRVSEDGIRITDADSKKHILFNVFFDRCKLKRYKCPAKPLIFSLNLNHLQGLVKTVKKKDVVVLSITSDTPTFLYLTIDQGANSEQRELYKVNIQVEKGACEPLTLPEVLTNEEGLEMKVYDYPFVIPSTTFQKVKKMTKVGVISVSIYKNDFIEFAYDTGLHGGKVQAGRYDEDDSSEDESGWFVEDFQSEIFDNLVKLPGLSTTIRFFSPKKERYPLKVGCDIGNFGEIFMYIKDLKQIEFEETQKKSTI